MATMLEIQPNLYAREIRKENRITAVLPVMVDFGDSLGPQPVCTYDVSLTGARIARPWSDVEIDQTFWLIRRLQKSLHRVVWIGAADSLRAGQIGVESVQDDRRIWDEDLHNALQALDEASDLAPGLAADPGALIYLEKIEIAKPVRLRRPGLTPLPVMKIRLQTTP